MLGHLTRRLPFTLAPILILFATTLHAQATRDITGQWQGTLEPPNDKSLRTIYVISKGDKGLAARMYNIDVGAQSFNAPIRHS